MSNPVMVCPNCASSIGAPGWKARSTVLWANQYGYKIRIFCKYCGQWTDYRHLWRTGEGKFVIVKAGTEMTIGK